RNKFTKTHGGIHAQYGVYKINDNIFIESPGIYYTGYWKSHKFEIKGNTFCKQKKYAIANNRIWNGNSNQAIIKSNNFCSVDRAAVKIGANRESNMNATGNYWNGASSSTVQRKMIWDRLDDINVYNHISWYPALSTPTGESLGGYSDKFGGTVLQSCLPDSSTNAGSICAVICEGLEIEGEVPEPVIDPGAEIPLTFPPAVIIPRSTPKGSDAILQSIFNIRVGHQWEGHLKKYKLNKDGSIGDLQWDAGELLNTNKPAANRNIFTVGDGLSVFGNNNFNISNFEALKPILYGDNHTNIDNEDAKKLINFVRGVDVFDEDKDESFTDKRWKLGDTYHADLLVVGPPNARVTDNPDRANTDASYRYNKGYHNFALANKNRKSVVFAAANDGMLHAFDLKTGEELWAFIPPMVLPRLQLMQSATANQSTSIYGVDGAPVVKDVFLSGKWKTIVMGGLGMGGHGYYALDVTDIENPVHMFSFSYDPVMQQGFIWQGKNGQKTSTSDFNKLGEAWSKPLMLRMPHYGWVAVFGGGFNNEISEYGSMAYIVGLENEGRLVKAISVYDTGNKLTNAVPTSMTAITPDSSDKANYTGAMVYFADLEGKLWKLDLTDQGSMFNMEQVFDAEASHPNKMPPGNGRLTYFAVAPSIGSDGKLRLFYGTGDMQDLMDNNQNVDNRFYGIKDQNFSNPAREGRGNKFTESSLLDTTNKTDVCSDEDDKGWKIKLGPTEKVTSKANVSYGTVTFSRYTPLTTENCELGKTSITGVDYQCGSEKFNIDLGTGITTVPTLYRGKLYIGISGDGINTFTPPEGWIKKDNLLMGEPGDLSNWKGVKVKSWRERF
ncbi:MAG: PQQ-binding-like beta-propeller repeat protein, partial [Candidatus Ruthia sp.]|nr:PQQ-binding-like beta-propeller repeat protein [Candidatus Ruthturnera sp.]